jgi:uncharacterized protein YwqG
MQKTSIHMEYDGIGECPIGSSKIGGNPDLPPTFQWFYYRGDDCNEVIANRPLSFLAQVNCKEASKFDESGLFPKKGMLYFFYEIATMKWGYDPKDKGCARIYYYDGEISALKKTDFPFDLSSEHQFPEIPVTFTSRREIPHFEELVDELGGYDVDGHSWEKYDKAKIQLGYKSDFDGNAEGSITKLLGYADCIQGSMLISNEMVTNGIYCGDSVKIPDDISQQIKNSSKQWQLLFQLDTIYVDSREVMMWGDMGRLYFYIKKGDLKQLNFENCWLQLQCG